VGLEWWLELPKIASISTVTDGTTDAAARIRFV
jgi:hypothetical protein